ncbi:MAG: asparagine synthase (glutamine-hydrolyzing) [Bacteroidales bacterium]|nr:asparagine synthase (glutamine-hydrolyzing) [Bacteroidales bacterium]
MCGIIGIIDLKKDFKDSSVIKNMMQSIKHRGPDGEGFFVESNVALGHVRLSIIDLSEEANQPMFSPDNNLLIVFNGEIYNFQDVKNELSSTYQFSTKSDTEVILNAYKEWGEDCLHKFNGMFAFAIYNRNEKTIFAARDRFGIKPFYYYLNEDFFIFGSEIKAILASDYVKAELNEEMLYDFIVFNRTDHTTQTCFKNINNLRPGHKILLNSQTGNCTIEQWYTLPDLKKENKSLAFYKDTLLKQLNESIRLHLVSDVPVGSALSGGLDSSALVTLMRRQMPDETMLHTFSAVYDKNWEKDEQKYIEALKKHIVINTTYTTPTAEKLLADLDKLIYQQEEPFASASMFASWCVYRKAHENGIKVLLNGQGADEVFAYDYMAAFYFYELFLGYNWFSLIKELWYFYRKQAYPLFTIKLFAFLIAPAFLKNRLIKASDPLIKKDFFAKYKDKSHFHKTFFKSKTLNENVKNHLLMKLHHLLRVEDKNAMMFSVEGRVPFLEHQLVEFALNIPPQLKVRTGEVKYILKQCMKHLLPDEIFNRNNKIGYETPMDRWFREPIFLEEMNDLLFNSEQPMAKFLDIDFVKTKWKEHLEGKNNGALIWKYFYLTKWYNINFKSEI